MINIENYIVIDDRCAWPNLTLMPNGDVIATIFNQPCHGKWEGDAECWGSTDGGKTWAYRGTPAKHEPGQNRMNVGGGLAKNGDLLIMCSGWSDRPKRGEGPPKPFNECKVLPALLSRSKDGGRTWEIKENILPSKPYRDDCELVPFGKLAIAEDGSLCQGVYTGRSVHVTRSYDDGRTWPELTLIAENRFCECDILHLGSGKWLAVTRNRRGLTNDLFASDDDGRTWKFRETLTLPCTSAAHIMRLKDGRIIFSFADRCFNRKGIDIRLSEDEGRTWSPPCRLKNIFADDCGYPSTVELPSGRMLTAYYASEDGAYKRYHMGVVLWDLKEMFG